MKSLTESVTTLKTEVREANRIIHEQAKLISFLNSEINRCNYRNDELQQYGRKESIKVHGLTDEFGNNATQIITDIVDEINENAVDSKGEKI